MKGILENLSINKIEINKILNSIKSLIECFLVLETKV